MSSPDQSGANTAAQVAPAGPKPVLEGSCRFAGCKVQHLHPITGVPPDKHWQLPSGELRPQWTEPSFRRRGNDPRDWWYRLEEIARTTGVCWQTVRRWIAVGGLKATRAPGGRVWLVKGRDLDEFLRTTDRVYPKPEDSP